MLVARARNSCMPALQIPADCPLECSAVLICLCDRMHQRVKPSSRQVYLSCVGCCMSGQSPVWEDLVLLKLFSLRFLLCAKTTF